MRDRAKWALATGEASWIVVGMDEMQHEGFTVWLTGLPCSGKSTLAHALTDELRAHGLSIELLDGDVVRKSLSQGLGFSREDRDINVQRIAFVAQLLSRNGVGVVVAAISPYRAAREAARAAIGRFVEVHVDCPLSVCEARDVKGHYALARAGKMSRFTGVDDPYEPPEHAEVTLRTDRLDVGASVKHIVAELRARGYLREAR